MLTQEDIQQLVKVIDERLKPINDKLDGQSKDTKSLKNDVKSLKSDVNKQGKDIIEIKKNTDVLIKATNRDDMRLQKRVKRIEDHLDLPALEEHPGAASRGNI